MSDVVKCGQLATYYCLSPQQVTANTRRSSNVDLLLGQRLRRWPDSKLTLCQRILFAWVLIQNSLSIFCIERHLLTIPPACVISY